MIDGDVIEGHVERISPSEREHGWKTLTSWAFAYTSIRYSKRELEMNKNSVVDWNNYLREVCANHLLQNPPKIGGPGLTVEIDESMFTKRKYNRGRLVREQWVFGGICRETDECFMYTVPNRRAETLMPIIVDSISPGTTIISDQWRAYNNIRNLNNNYVHLTVNHSLNFVDPVTGAHTQKKERNWNGAKAKFRARWGYASTNARFVFV